MSKDPFDFLKLSDARKKDVEEFCKMLDDVERNYGNIEGIKLDAVKSPKLPPVDNTLTIILKCIFYPLLTTLLSGALVWAIFKLFLAKQFGLPEISIGSSIILCELIRIPYYPLFVQAQQTIMYGKISADVHLYAQLFQYLRSAIVILFVYFIL